MLRAFLVRTIKQPGESYQEQKRLLHVIEELQPDHMRILVALDQAPEHNLGIMGSPIATLEKRIAGMPPSQIEDLVMQLNDMRVVNIRSLHTMMTSHGAADLKHTITPFGQRLIDFINH